MPSIMISFKYFTCLISFVIYTIIMKGEESVAHLTIDDLEFNKRMNSNIIVTEEKIINSSIDTDSIKDFVNQSNPKVTAKPRTTKKPVVYSTPTVTSGSSLPTSTDLVDDDSCFITKESTSGVIQSPVSDGKDKILQCDWIITVPTNHLVRLKFVEFDLPLMSDMRCRDGFLMYGSFDANNKKIIGHEFCGKNKPKDFTSVGNRCWIYYQLTRQTEVSKFELIFDAVYVEDKEGSNRDLSLMALLVMIVPVFIGIFVLYVIFRKRRREKMQRRNQVEMFDRFRDKHERNKILLLSRKKKSKNKNIKIRTINHKDLYQNVISKPSDEIEHIRKYFGANISEIKASGEYQMVPGHFCVKRVMIPSGISADGSVFLSESQEEDKPCSASFNSHNFLSIPDTFSHKRSIPSYMSFPQPSVSSLGDFDTNHHQTTVAMVTKSMDSLESIPELSPYNEHPSYHKNGQNQFTNTSGTTNNQLPYMVSDTSVFSNEHPMTLDRKTKRRKTHSSTFMTPGKIKRSKYNTISWNDAKRSSFNANTTYHSSDSNIYGQSYRPGSGHHKFLSNSSITGNNSMPKSNLTKGKWDNKMYLNETGYKLSSNNCCSMQNLSEMRDMCKTMPVIHVSSYSSIFEELNTLAYSHHLHGNFMSDSSSLSSNDIMSLINEEVDTTETTSKEFDNPAFVMDESPSPKKDNSQLKSSCSKEQNKSLVDINNNTEIHDNEQESRSFVLNEFFPGRENQVIVLDRGETMV